MLNFTRPVLAATAVLALGTVAGAAATGASAPAEATEQASPELGATAASTSADLPQATPIATPPAETPRTKPIECGGYDEDGNLVSPEAAATDEVPVREDGSYVVPDFCHGYTEDGVFIGDD